MMKKQIEKIFQRPATPHMVGNGFRVFNLIPGVGITQQRISPFLMLDFNPEYDFGPSEQPLGVDVHPHKGFETVTIAYKGSVAHEDSMGNAGVIHPGDVQWMTAGNGILHKEFHEKTFSQKGGPFEMVQLWVNLPRKYKTVSAHYQSLPADGMGKVMLPEQGGTVNVIAGNFNGTKGPAHSYTPVNLFDLRLNKGGTASFEISENHHTALLVLQGKILVNEQPANTHQFVLFSNEGTGIEIQASEDSTVLVMSGQPIDEPIASYGPFVLNTQEEIVSAIQDFQAGKFGTLT